MFPVKFHSFIHSTTCTPNLYKKQPLSSKNNPDKKFSQLHAQIIFQSCPCPFTALKSIYFLFKNACIYVYTNVYCIYSLPHSLSQLTGYPFNIFLFFPNIFLTNLSTWNYVILSILCHNSIMGQQLFKKVNMLSTTMLLMQLCSCLWTW